MEQRWVVWNDDHEVVCVTATEMLARAVVDANMAAGYDHAWDGPHQVVETIEEAERYYPEEEEEEEEDRDEVEPAVFDTCIACGANTLRTNADGEPVCLGCQAGEPVPNAP